MMGGNDINLLRTSILDQTWGGAWALPCRPYYLFVSLSFRTMPLRNNVIMTSAHDVLITSGLDNTCILITSLAIRTGKYYILHTNYFRRHMAGKYYILLTNYFRSHTERRHPAY